MFKNRDKHVLDDKESGQLEAKTAFRWFRFKLRTLMIAVTLLAGLAGLMHWQYVPPYRMQQRVARKLEAAGAKCKYAPAPLIARFFLADYDAKVVVQIDLTPLVASPRKKLDDQTLKEIGGLWTLEELDASHQDVTDDILNEWEDLSALRILWLRSTLVEHVHGWPQWRLENLNLTNTFVPADEIAHISKYEFLRTLHCDALPVDDNNLPALLEIESLKNLDVIASRVTSKSWPRLKTKEFKYLALSDGEFYVPGIDPWIPDRVEFEASIRDKLKNLGSEELNSGAVTVNLDSAGHLHLDALRRRDDVTMLKLDSHHINDQTLEHLTLFPNLTELSVENSWITDEGVRMIARCSRLEVLSLGDTRVSDEAIHHLEACGGLRVLKLNGTCVSHESIRDLCSFPSLEIVFLPLNAIHCGDAETLAMLEEIQSVYVCDVGRWDKKSRTSNLNDAKRQLLIDTASRIPYDRPAKTDWDSFDAGIGADRYPYSKRFDAKLEFESLLPSSEFPILGPLPRSLREAFQNSGSSNWPYFDVGSGGG